MEQDSLYHWWGTSSCGVAKGREFPETHTGGWGAVIWFVEDVKLRGFPS